VAGEFDELEVAQAAPETVLHGELVDDAHQVCHCLAVRSPRVLERGRRAN
jgi:hypothetical protein